MRIVLTTGPSFEPIDQVRRLTNFSSGELGTILAERFAEAEHSVVCFRGSASTFAPPLWPVQVVPFTTNANLEEVLLQLPQREGVNLVFHAAALSDFRVGSVCNEKGEPVRADKLPSRAGPLHLTLEPAPKVIASLRKMFPASIIVGWKYELDGTRQEALTKGRKQIEECLTDACVVNGKAYGAGFGVLTREGELTHLPDKKSLCQFLLEWTERIPMANAKAGPESFHPLATFLPLSPFI